MLVRVLLQTSLVLWLAQQTLQRGVRPQTASWGRLLPSARGVGVGVKPHGVGALGAAGSRYGSKAMKAGIGRYSGAQLGVGYRAGVGVRPGLRPGGYGTQGAYGMGQGAAGTGLGTGMGQGGAGTGLGTGMGQGAGFANGMGMNLGQGAKRAYGTGLGTHPGYGAFAGNGYPGARPGVPTSGLGGPEMANLGQAVQDLKKEKSRGVPYGKRDRAPGLETPSMRRTYTHDATPPELHTDSSFRPALLPPGGEVKSLDPQQKSPSLGPLTTLDKQRLGLAVSPAQVGETYKPAVSERRGPASPGAPLVAGGERQQPPHDKDNIGSPSSASSQPPRPRDYDSPTRQNQQARNCGSASDLPDELEINRHELLGSETQSLLPKPKGSKHLGPATPQEERTYRPPQIPQMPQIQDARGYAGGAGNYMGANLGNGGYGQQGLGQGGYLGGAAGKHAGYGDGATGYQGAMGGNGYGYGNGYGNGYGAGLGYPADLAGGAESKAGKSKGFNPGAYAGQVQGAYGSLGAGLDSNGGKYGGGAPQVPYGNSPMIPTGLEGEGGYPYTPQQLALAAESAKTASKYGAGARFGQQTGYGAQLGAPQEALGEHAGKFGGGGSDALGNGYKG